MLEEAEAEVQVPLQVTDLAGTRGGDLTYVQPHALLSYVESWDGVS